MLDRLLGIARAARVETGIRSQHRADDVALQLDQTLEDDAHCLLTARQCFSRLRTMAALSASRAPERALTTMSTAGSSCWCWRNDSRTRRLIRLRRTAPPMMRAAIASPRRGTLPPVWRAKIAKQLSAKRRASR